MYTVIHSMVNVALVVSFSTLSYIYVEDDVMLSLTHITSKDAASKPNLVVPVSLTSYSNARQTIWLFLKYFEISSENI